MTSSPRHPDAPIDPLFVERWSPRAFTEQAVTPAELDSLLEAARWAPSSANEQPWLFVLGVTPAHHAQILSLLVPGNQVWAGRAPVLGVIFSRRTFAQSGKPNRWAAFDAGAAWMSLALQATRLGLSCHAMGGFDAERALTELKVPADQYEAHAALAIGHRGPPEQLPDAYRARELPNQRRPRQEGVHFGPLP